MSTLEDIARKDCDLEMTPMIDVTFLLLIFFMCTIKFKTLEGKLTAFLPQDVGVTRAQAEEPEKVQLEIRVIQPGTKLDVRDAHRRASRDPRAVRAWSGDEARFVFGDDRVLEYRLGPRTVKSLPVLLERLEQRFTTARAEGFDDLPLTIDPGPGTVYEDVVHVLDQAVIAGFTDISFVGSYED